MRRPSLIARPRPSGVALVIVLAMLVLILVLVLAFFSKAVLHRQISSSSVANMEVQILSQTATDFLLDDFTHEIEAGSEPDPNPHFQIGAQRPILIDDPQSEAPVAPSMAPQRVGDQGAVNVVKVSRNGERFFSTGPGYREPESRSASGPARASDISTIEPAVSGRYIPEKRWNRAKLMTAQEIAGFSPPDWIYLDREGKNPTDFAPPVMPELASSAPENGSYVIGRYAYVVYDTGGLIDINVAGNRLNGAENGRRGRMHQVSLLDGIGEVRVPEFRDFVTWRSSITGEDPSSVPGEGGLFDPRRTFLEVPPGEQTFVHRQDLLAYAARPGSPLPEDLLPLVTTFSRDLDAPSFAPDPNRVKEPATPDADQMNPALLSIRFQEDTTLERPEGAITVKAGAPVMPRRFPLSKLGMFELADPDPAAMLYYFGLTREDSAWEYTATIEGRIAKLSEVAELKREPNFFEVLQSVIYTGSLGRSVSDTYTFEAGRDGLQNLQIMQIGANIIDQWDTDDFPTRLQYPSGNTGEFLDTYGVENLPYVSQIGMVGWRPTDDRDRFQAWALFDVWNPHQNAKLTPKGIDGFRIRPVGGKGRLNVWYSIIGISGVLQKRLNSEPSASGGTLVLVPNNDLLGLNAGRALTFSPSGDYSDPVTLGAIPSSANDRPGLLMADITLGKAIPPVEERSEAMQITVDQIKAETGKDAGVKAHNTFRLASNGLPDHWQFALQAHYEGEPAGQWHTYQTFEFVGGRLLDIATNPVGGESHAAIPTHTHHSMEDAPLVTEFYNWRGRGASVGMVKADPRTNRFGFSGWSQNSATTDGNDFLGRSIRSSLDELPAALLNDDRGSLTNNHREWAIPGGVYATGRDAPKTLSGGFELVPAFEVPPQKNRYQIGLFGMVSNHPDLLSASHPMHYNDPDSTVRPGDGYFGGVPTAPGQFGARPIVLNRPFRSVGELGHAFRDMPWKTMDFFSRYSADLGLLDAFSLSETSASRPITAGKVNLNSRQPAVLEAILRNSSKQLSGVNDSVPGTTLTAAQAKTLAAAIVKESKRQPFRDRGDLVARVMNSAAAEDPLPDDTAKVAREAAVRTLSEMATTRTWNFMIDLIAQTGRFTAASKDGSDFLVEGEERTWIHVAIDRLTGEVLEVRKEYVNE